MAAATVVGDAFEHGQDQGVAVGEVAVDGHAGHAGLASDVVHRYTAQTPAADAVGGRVEDLPADRLGTARGYRLWSRYDVTEPITV
jgi:hypothetical protein